jgi:hypothetical protein
LARKGHAGPALEEEFIASLTHERPLCLYGEGTPPQVTQMDQGVAMGETYEHWIGADTHVLHRAAELSNQLRIAFLVNLVSLKLKLRGVPIETFKKVFFIIYDRQEMDRGHVIKG